MLSGNRYRVKGDVCIGMYVELASQLGLLVSASATPVKNCEAVERR
jgi:hypothetical protein